MVSLISAGTILPSSKITKSPVTKSSALISLNFPFLLTIHWGEESFFKASRAFSALDSWIVPTMLFKKITTKIIIASAHSFKHKEIMAAPINTIIIGLQNCNKNLIINGFFFFSGREFLPSNFNFSNATSWLNPSSNDVLSSFSRYLISLISNIITNPPVIRLSIFWLITIYMSIRH